MAGAAADPARVELAAEMLYDVYLGALFRWMRDDSPPEGVFFAEMDRAIDIALHGVAGVLGTTRPWPGSGMPPGAGELVER